MRRWYSEGVIDTSGRLDYIYRVDYIQRGGGDPRDRARSLPTVR